MSDFQDELKNDYGFENIVIIAVGSSFFNTATTDNFCANSNLPVVLDNSPEFPIRAQFSPYDEHKSLTFIGYDGEFLANVSLNSFDENTKSQIIDILTNNYQNNIIGDINSDELVNVLDVVLIVNLILSSSFDTSADINEDNVLDILDIVNLINIIIN